MVLTRLLLKVADSHYQCWLLAGIVSRGKMWLVAIMTKRPIQPQDKYVVRLPDGLRDRIKAYADRHGRSMNAEIVRVLEREYPEPWTVEQRAASLLGMIAMLKAADTSEQFTTLNDALEETIEGIVSGRMTDVDEETRKRIGARFETWRLERAEDDYAQHTWNMDEEELASLDRGHGTSKF